MTYQGYPQYLLLRLFSRRTLTSVMVISLGL